MAIVYHKFTCTPTGISAIDSFTATYTAILLSALFIQPHPDDNEIGAGGTIALLREKGLKVYGLTVTRGEGGCSDPQISADEIAAIRDLEANEAMRQLDILNLGYDELSSIPHEKLVAEIVSILHQIKVDAVFTVDPQLKNELHPTHIQVGNAVCEAFMRCGIIHFPPGHKACCPQVSCPTASLALNY